MRAHVSFVISERPLQLEPACLPLVYTKKKNELIPLTNCYKFITHSFLKTYKILNIMCLSVNEELTKMR